MPIQLSQIIVVSDEEDRVCCERRVPNDLEKVVALLEPFRNDLVGVAVESTFNWYWLVTGLRAAGFEVKLVNTAAIAQYDGLKYSGDEHDARHLAHLRRLKLLHFDFAFEPEWRAVRDLGRKRLQLVRIRTAHVLALETIFARQAGGRISGRAAKEIDIDDVARLGWPEDATLAAQVNVLAVQAMERGIAIHGTTFP